MPPILTITPLIVTLDVGESAQLQVSPNPNGVKWTCADCHIAKVDNNGLVTGLAEGSTTVTGTRGNQSTTINVTVSDVPVDPPPPQPPTVGLQALNGETEADTWQFGTNNTDPAPGDSIVQAIFDPGDGSTPIEFPGPPDDIINHNWPSDGNFTVSLFVLTALGLTNSTSLIAQVTPVPSPEPPDPTPNVKPQAQLTFVSGQFTNQTVTLSSVGTFDPDGTLVNYVFEPGDGSSVSLPQAPPLSLTYSYPQAGTYLARLTVTDNGGLSTSAEINVVIIDQPTQNQPPVAVLAQLSGSFAGDTASFSTVGSFDPDGIITSWQFQGGNGNTQGTTGVPPPQLLNPYPGSGTFTARLTVFDAGGLSNTAQIQVTISPAPSGGNYPYYNGVIARPDRYLAYSLRDQSQLIQNNGASAAPDVIYDVGVDAAKATIPPFSTGASTTLAAGVNSSQTNFTFTTAIIIQNGRAYKIDNEIVIADRVTSNPVVFQYLRGQYGTTAAAHLAGAGLFGGRTSLGNQVRCPINTQNGHMYFFGWEVMHDTAMQDHDFKAFQMSLAQGQRIWFEPHNRMSGLSGGVGARTYGQGANMTDSNPVQPTTGSFTITPDRWFRLWAYIDQRPTIPLWTLWAGDAVTGVVKLFDGRQLPYISGFLPIVDKWWIEYNTSSNVVDAQQRTLTAYIRNLFVLRDVEQANVPLSVAGLVP